MIQQKVHLEYVVGRIQSRIIGVLIVLLENLLYGHELFNGNTREAHILQLFNHIKQKLIRFTDITMILKLFCYLKLQNIDV